MQHRIQKYIFDVDFGSEDKAYQYQNQLAVYIKEKILAVTDEVFTEYSSKHTLGIQRLTIDIGEISMETMDNLSSIIKTHLSDKLKQLTSGMNDFVPGEQLVVIPQAESDLKMIEYFFEKGILPWSASKDDASFIVHRYLMRYIHEKPSDVKRILSNKINKPEVRVRMIRQFQDEVIWKIIELWSESETPKFKVFYADFVKVYLKRKILKNYYVEFRELLWKFMVFEVVELKKINIETPVIVSDFFEFAAKETKIPVIDIINDVHSVVAKEGGAYLNIPQTHDQPLRPESSLATIVEVLKKEFSKTKTKQTPHQKQDVRISENLDSIKKSDETALEAEDFHRLEIKKQRVFLKAFFEAVAYASSLDEVLPLVGKASVVIKQLIGHDPGFIRKTIDSQGLNIQQLKGQYALSIFDDEVQSILLREVFKTDKVSFEFVKATSSQNAILQFLQTGYIPKSILPGFFKEKDLKKMIQSVVERDTEGKLTTEIKKWKVSSQKKERYVERQILAEYFPEIVSNKNTLKQTQKAKVVELKSGDSFVHVLEYFFKQNQLPEFVAISLPELIEQFYSLYNSEADVYMRTLDGKKLEQVKQHILPHVSSSIAKRILEVRAKQDQLIEELTQSQLAPEPQKASAEAKEAIPFKKFESGEPVYINNAGLIIFHPYLSRFFKMMDLLDKKSFKDEFSAHKAAHLLQYLTNKSLNNEEHEMPLNKLLCGIDLSVPLMREIEITEEEKNICEGLIEGVIQNWSILKKTSNDNFRASFILREGRLLQENRDWRLKVEERGYDILVEKLPWSISMIKLPWMNQMIYVEWK